MSTTTTDALVQRPSAALAHSQIALPRLIERAGETACARFLEFFVAQIRNRNTRRAYARACARFLDWCDERGLELDQLSPIVVAAYIEELETQIQPASVKQHLAAIRMLGDYLVLGHVLPTNPAASVRGPKHVVREGKTPVLFSDDVRVLFDALDVETVVGLRDRAILATMLYSFARVGALTKMRVRDYYSQGRRAYFLLREKGGRWNRVPAHHLAALYLDEYLAAAAIAMEPESPLFRATRGRSGVLTDRPVSTSDVLRMIKRRCADAGLPTEISPHSFRATGITNYLEHGGHLETAAQIAGHASPRTTKLYDRRDTALALEEIERIRF